MPGDALQEVERNAPPLQEDSDLRRLLDRLVAAFEPEAVYLFGSRAEGRARQDSDYDLLVVVPDDSPDDRVTIEAGFLAKKGTGIAADVIPCRRRTFDRNRNRVGTLSYVAANRGRLVYGG